MTIAKRDADVRSPALKDTQLRYGGGVTRSFGRGLS